MTDEVIRSSLATTIGPGRLSLRTVAGKTATASQASADSRSARDCLTQAIPGER